MPTTFERDAWLNAARRGAYAGDYDDARRRLETVLEHDAHDDEARTMLARIHAWQGEYVQAEQLYREVLTRHPHDDDARAGLFDVL
ncbi:MAG TPA: tetratricopeptide repeat protein, partial [Polyangium sp.]|nr:tetratricopeptide repeat protein [Polyangium sp.]